jgi:hypothetical protein
MEWLKEHAYIATWLSPLIAVVGIVLSVRKAEVEGKPVNWTRLLLMVLCLTSFPVVVTPTFDNSAREFARFVFSFTIAAIVVMRRE